MAALLVVTLLALKANRNDAAGFLSAVTAGFGVVTGMLVSFGYFRVRDRKDSQVLHNVYSVDLADSYNSRLTLGLARLQELADLDNNAQQSIANYVCAIVRGKMSEAGEIDTSASAPKIQQITSMLHWLVERLRPQNEEYWKGIDIDLHGCTLPDISFAECAVRSISFENSVFSGLADFRRCSVTENAFFSRATFRLEVSFREALIGGSAVFDSCHFAAMADFRESAFEHDAVFDGSLFAAEVSYNKGYFHSRTSFAGTAFRNTADFRGSRFAGVTRFTGAHFEGLASFENSRFDGDAFFNSAAFDRELDISNANFESSLDLANASFSGEISVTRRSGLRLDILDQDEIASITGRLRISAAAGNDNSASQLGAILADQGKIAEAIAWLEKSARLGDTDSMGRLASLSAARGDGDGAAAWIKRVVGEDKRTVAHESGSNSSVIRTIDPATGQVVQISSWNIDSVVALSPVMIGGNQMIAGATHSKIQIWDIRAGVLHSELIGHTGRITALTILSEGDRQLLASASDDRTLRTWDPETGQMLTVVEYKEHVVSLCAVRIDNQERLLTLSNG
ncbi:pentapeptide repeat-containing protein [Nocardia salmonicida]|uniref:pentapeptide repeat-containing protein n=1 Tax=Nocardia salmonicida TaxID=53431 RepID=UPI003CE868C4